MPTAHVVLADILQRVLGANGPVAIAWLVAALVLGAVGFPLPEEIVLATGGFLAERGRIPPVPAFLACWATLWVADACTYEVGRRAGSAVRRSRVGRTIPRRRWAWLRRHMSRHGVLTVVIARFVMGARIATFLAAGAARMPRVRFWMATGLTGLVSGGVPFLLGWWLADALPALFDHLHVGRWVIAGVVGVVILGFGLRQWRRRRAAPRG